MTGLRPNPRDESAIALQRAYYARTANMYEKVHVDARDEHSLALEMLAAFVRFHGYKSILDVGAGTGRALRFINSALPGTDCIGVEPSKELRAEGERGGIKSGHLIDGDALALKFEDNSFEVVCAFGILHHIKDHRRAVSEMVRVARRAVFISDANNFGQGSLISRIVKNMLRQMGMWRAFDWFRTGFKGYHYSEGDGFFYSYSMFDDIPIIRQKFENINLMNTRPSGNNFLRSAQTLALHATILDKDHAEIQ